ncbi:MAG TPA: hypothetical protein VIK59_05010 [Verrucomicrobiae bacterium]
MTQKSKRKLTNLELCAPARGSLSRLKRRTKWTKTAVVENAILFYERHAELGGKAVPS